MFALFTGINMQERAAVNSRTTAPHWGASAYKSYAMNVHDKNETFNHNGEYMKYSIIITLAAIAAIICAGCGDNAVSNAQDQQADDFARRYSGNGRGITPYTLTVNRNPTAGGSVTVGSQQNPGTMTHNAGAQITITANPNQGWTFTGWTGTPQGVNAANANITVTMNSNLTLTANFQQQTGGIHTITFNPNGSGASVNPTTAVTGADGRLTSLPTPERTDHRFDGWFTAAIGGTAVTTITVFNSNTTIFAQWTQNQAQTFIITFNANGGTVTLTNATTGTDGKLTNLPTPTRADHSFDGWFTAATGGQEVTTTTVFNSNTTIFAQWTQNQAQNVVRGSFTDTRNSRTYNTVRIGGGREWMAENLNYTASSGVTANGVGSWCYGNNDSNCNTYGRLYTWDAAMSACPSGWRLPTRQEWTDLVTAAGGWSVAGRALKARSPTWDGDNTSGFSALPGGFRRDDGSFVGLGDWGYWRSAAENDAGRTCHVFMYTDNRSVSEGWNDKSFGLSVRCVRD